MDASECPGCRARDVAIAELQERLAARDARVADLEKRMVALEARLGTNSSNSSVPPSANPPGAPKPVIKKKSKRKRGGQPGHRAHLKQLLPPDRVDHVVVLKPDECDHCHAALPAQASADDPPPTRFQTIELPPIVAVVTEYQGHARICPCCGKITRKPIPREILAHSVEPRLAATLSYLAGRHGISKRSIEEIAEDVFQAPIALGTVSNLEQEMSAALAAPHQEAIEAVQAAAVKSADETSWKRQGKLCWLWAAATTTVAVFVIHARRSALGLAAILGTEIQGILCSDRWGVYDRVPAARRQICWAHLKRDFQKIVDRGGPGVEVGRAGLKIVKKVFAAWHEFKDGRCTRAQLEAQLAPVMNRMNRVLLEGAILGDDKTVATFCENVLALEPALWTFATTEGVEPTNNFMERLVRLAVLWRRRSFGCASEAGCRFVERILTVVQTRKLQGRNVLDYLHDALRSHRTGKTCPKLLSAP
jgi:transposase